MITEFKIKCLTDRGLTKCYISKILFYILPVTGSILNCYQKCCSAERRCGGVDPMHPIDVLLGWNPSNGKAKVMNGRCSAAETPD